MKNEIGKVKRSAYDLPSTDHVYGKIPIPDKEGAGDVVMKW